MLNQVVALVLSLAATLSVPQMTSSNYERGTITAVAKHVPPSSTDTAADQYDVTVRISNMEYTVLYTAPSGVNIVEYSPGMDMLFLVGAETLTFNSRLSGTKELPILSRQALSSGKGVDVSKIPGHYFSLKLQNLTEKLNLNQDQQTKIKPILEQETGEVGQFWMNPVLSQEEKLNRLENVVRASDKKLKPLLTSEQVDKLRALRKGQKERARKFLAESAETPR